MGLIEYKRPGGFYNAISRLRVGKLPAGISNDYGIYTPIATDTLSLWSNRTSGSGNVSTALVADVNSATINTGHKVTSWQWIDNNDLSREVAYLQGDGDLSVASNGLHVGSLPSGMDSDFGVHTTATTDTLSLWGTRADGSGNISVAAVADVNAAAINAGHKILSAQWIDNTDTATEVAYIEGDGDLSLVEEALRLGTLPAGRSNDFGVYTPTNTDTLGLWSTLTTAADAVSVNMVADINAAVLDLDHILAEIGWVDNADTYTDVWKFKEDQLEHGDATVAELFGTETDGAGAVGVRLGSDEEFTVPGSKLVEIWNDATERANVDYMGSIAMHMDDNGGAFLEDYLTALVTVNAGPYTIAPIGIPGPCQVHSIAGCVVTDIPGAASLYVGVSGVQERYADEISAVAGTQFDGMMDGVRYYADETNVYLTPNTAPSAATGEVRLVIHYTKVIPPNS